MANELKHGSVGTELTQAEWEGIGTHVVANQAVGDLIYASTTSQLRRLAISGTATHILSISGGIPAWAAPAAAAAGSLTGSTLASGVTASSLTSVGTLTDLTVSGTSTTIGTVTSGIWNAGAVTSSGAVTGASLVADLTTLDANTLSTSSGNLTISAATGADVLIGDNETLIYVDGGFNTLGFWSVGVNSVQAYFEFDGITMPANTSADRMRLTWGAPMVIPSGTTALAGTLNIEEPNLTATGTVTNAYTVRINNAPSEGGTGNYALWVAAGASQFGGNVGIDGDLTFTGPQTISTSTGDLTLTAGSSTGDVLIGDGDGTILYVDGGTGCVGVGTAPPTSAMLNVGGTFTGGSFTSAVRVVTALTDPPGNGTNSIGVHIATDFTEVADASTTTRASLRVVRPTITARTGAAVTNSASVYISDAPTGGATPTNGPHSIFVDAGTTRLDGGIKINTESADALISEATSGSGTVTHYIGNETIDTTASDIRVKENIEPFTDSVMPLLEKMRVSEFNFIGAPGETILGLMAQEVDEYAPELVKKGPTSEDTMAVKYNYMVPYLVKAIQELNERMEA